MSEDKTTNGVLPRTSLNVPMPACRPPRRTWENEQRLEAALRSLVVYTRWQIVAGADHHPTLPSALAEAEEALRRG